MGKTAFDEFIRQEKTIDSENKNIDWKDKKDVYLSRVNALYKDIESFLSDYTESGDIRIEKGSTLIEEEYIGKYDAPVLHIHLYGKHADLIPAGTNMIGSPGRVDLLGDIETRRIILADENEKAPAIFAAFSFTEEEKEQNAQKAEEWANRERNYVWKIITDPPKIHYIELTEDSFLSLLQEVLGG